MLPPFKTGEVAPMKQTFRVNVVASAGSVPIEGKLIQIQLEAKESGSNAYFSDAVLARTGRDGSAEFKTTLESGKDGEYRFRSYSYDLYSYGPVWLWPM